MVEPVQSHLFQVIMLAAHTDTFLSVHGPRGSWLGLAKENGLELVHTGIGEEQCGIIDRDHGRTPHETVFPLLKEINEALAYVCCSHT